MLKEGVMHLPELPLFSSSFRGLCRMLSMRMCLSQGKVPKDKAQPLPQSSLDLLHDGIGLSTIGTLIIPVFYQGHRSGFWPLLMIALTHWRCEPGNCGFLCHFVVSSVFNASRAVRIPSAPGLIPT